MEQGPVGGEAPELDLGFLKVIDVVVDALEFAAAGGTVEFGVREGGHLAQDAVVGRLKGHGGDEIALGVEEQFAGGRLEHVQDAGFFDTDADGIDFLAQGGGQLRGRHGVDLALVVVAVGQHDSDAAFAVLDGLEPFGGGSGGVADGGAEVADEADVQPVKVFYRFKNDEKSGLGMPLPAGTVRVYQADSKGEVQFGGEDTINHTPKDEALRIYVGNAFDIVCERKQTDYKKLASNLYELEYEITLRNHKDSAVNVEVREPVGGDWEVLNSNYKWTKLDASTIGFQIPVDKDGTATVDYRVRVKW